MENTAYEFFIRRAHDCDRYGVPGADTDIWEGLKGEEIESMQENATNKQKKAYEKRLENVKGYVEKALVKAYKRLSISNNQAPQLETLKQLQDSSKHATSRADIEKIVLQGMDIFIECNIGFTK